jgi:hypothetical protein
MLNMGAGGIKVGIAGDDIAFTGNSGKEYIFGSTSLVSWNEMLEAGDITYG